VLAESTREGITTPHTVAAAIAPAGGTFAVLPPPLPPFPPEVPHPVFPQPSQTTPFPLPPPLATLPSHTVIVVDDRLTTLLELLSTTSIVTYQFPEEKREEGIVCPSYVTLSPVAAFIAVQR
jgi:hypothetical protein